MNGIRGVMSWLVLSLLLVPAMASAEKTSDKSDVVNVKVESATAPALITKMTGDELFARLAKEGLVPERLKDKVIRVKLDMINVLFFVEEDLESIQAFAGFQSNSASVTKVNDWNRDKRYSRAYMDKEGNYVIELDLDLAGGVTPARFEDFLKTARLSIKHYSEHISD